MSDLLKSITLTMQQTQYFLFCRPGFEVECGTEIQEKAQHVSINGFFRIKKDSGYVIFEATEQNKYALFENVSLTSLIFTRQWFAIAELHTDLPPTDRIAPLLSSIQQLGITFCHVLFETPDTNQGKELSPLCKKIEPIFLKKLEKERLIDKRATARLHVCFLSTIAAYVGFSQSQNDRQENGGIIRLRSPPSAPSRSTLKLEEAFYQLLTEQEQTNLLRSESLAVDLGASPGGWTWQLVKRRIRVIAVDNGKMDEQLMQSGLVEHLQVDGFKYKPPINVDWMVCDIVEQPIRVIDLVVKWLQNDWCRFTIFNLKLPMKKRYDEIKKCFEQLNLALSDEKTSVDIRAKQLFHDREEITVFVSKKQTR